MKESYTLTNLQKWKESGAPSPPTVRLGVVGDPVAHSLSPAMQNAALAECEIPLQYARFQISPNDLPAALHTFRDLGFLGLNLTVPHKVSGFSLVGKVDSFARQIGAINTIRFDDGKSIGRNTDGPGFARAIRESFGVDLHELRVLLLGAGGGAGRAIAWQCAREKCPRLVLVNRTFARAEALAHELAAAQISALPWEETSLGRALAEIDLIVNATPPGSKKDGPPPLPPAILAPHHLVYDLVYRPTPLLTAAAAAGARGANGLTMLLHQGALAFEFWLRRPAPLAEMRRALGL